jgi:peptidoglycan biosynthesis protein MviN/MurJ (putative lipid II flippase)
MLSKNSYKNGVLWMLLFNILARGISFVLSVVLAKNFLPVDTDVYLYIGYLISAVLVIVSAINLMAAGPEYIRLCENGETQKAADLNSAIVNIYLLPLLLFALLTFILPVKTYELISGFDRAQLLPVEEMLRFSGCWLILVILNNFLGNILLSRKYFVGSILGQVIAAVVTLLVIILFKEEFGISSFFIGQIAGNLLCFLFYVYQLRLRIKEKFRLFYFRLEGKVLKELVSSIMIAVPTLVTNIILIYLLSHLVTGQLSAYNYGSALANLPDVILLSQFISIIGVKFSEISANEERVVLLRALRYFGTHLFFFMSGVAVIIALTSPVIISVIYGKDSFDTLTFNSAALTLMLISSTLAFKALDIMHNRVFASIQALSVLVKYTFPLKIASICLLILLASQFGFEGILVHQLSMPVIMVAMQLYLLGKYLEPEKLRAYIGRIVLLTFGSMAVYAGCRYLLSYVFIHIPVVIQVLLTCVLVLMTGIFFERIFKTTMLFDVVLKRVALFFNKQSNASG